MGSCHVAHDCKIGSNNIFANGTLLAGHVVVEVSNLFYDFFFPLYLLPISFLLLVISLYSPLLPGMHCTDMGDNMCPSEK